MFKQIFITIIISSCFTACVLTPPSTSPEGSKVIMSNLRSVEVRCSEESVCLTKNEGEELKAVVFYAKEECRLFDNSSEVVAMQAAALNCGVKTEAPANPLDSPKSTSVAPGVAAAAEPCHAKLESFLDLNGDKLLLVEEGQYSLLAFIDVNQNNFPDVGEPFYCNDTVEISPYKRLVNISLQIVKTLE